MDTVAGISVDNAALHAHLGYLQAIVGRMATNSANCKTWCLGIISGLLAVAADSKEWRFIVLCFIPLALFLFLDCYYLALERSFRTAYDSIVERIQRESVGRVDLFAVKPSLGGWDVFLTMPGVALSPSIAPFYGLLLVAVLIVRRWMGV